MKKRKLNKFTGTFGLAIISSLILSACGANNNYGDNVLVSLPFLKQSRQFKSFQEIAKSYNEKLTEATRNEGYLPVKVIFGGSDYNDAETQTTIKISAGDRTNIPNLTFGYPSTVYKYEEIGKNPVINFSEQQFSDVPAFDGENVFSPGFQQINKNIGLVKLDGTYLLSTGDSIEMSFFSKPVFNYLLNTLLRYGTNITINSDDVNWFKSTFGVEKKETSVQPAQAQTEEVNSSQPQKSVVRLSDSGSSDTSDSSTPHATNPENSSDSTTTNTSLNGDQSTKTNEVENPTPLVKYEPNTKKIEIVEKYYGDHFIPKGQAKPTDEQYKSSFNKKSDSQSVFPDGYVLKASVFDAYEDFLTFINQLADAFHISPTNKRALIGYSTEFSNLLFLNTFMSGGNDYSKFLWTKDNSSNDYKYLFLGSDSAAVAQQNKLKTQYETLIAPISKGAAWTPSENNADKFGTSFLKKINLGFVSGSSSGYRWIYNPEKTDVELEDQDVYVKVIDKLKSTDTTHTYLQRGGSLLGLHTNKQLDKATRLFVNWFYNQNINDKKLTTQFEYKNQDHTAQVSAVEYYALKSGYVPGNQSFYDDLEQSKNLLADQAAQKAFEYFSNARKNASQYHLFSIPAGALTPAILSQTRTNITLNGDTPKTFDQLMQSYKNNPTIQSNKQRW